MVKERKKEEEIKLNVEFQKARFTDFETCYEKSRLLRECTDPSLPGFDGQHGLCPVCGGWDGSIITRHHEMALCAIHRIFWDAASANYPEMYEGEFKEHADYLRAFWFWGGDVLYPPYDSEIMKWLGVEGRSAMPSRRLYESTAEIRRRQSEEAQ